MGASECRRPGVLPWTDGEDIACGRGDECVAYKSGSNSIPIASTVTEHPRPFVVSTNQSRACLSASVSVRRDIPISVGPLEIYQIDEIFIH
jgi:hypothetical protein